jgi:hypothetical protein
MRGTYADGSENVSETAWRDTSLSGFADALNRVSSVSTVASVIMRNSDTARLETVSSVRRLLRRTFLSMSFVNRIAPFPEPPVS